MRLNIDLILGVKHILSLSYGKDSLACLGAIEKLHLPLDRIIHIEMLACEGVSADLPEVVAFKEKADKFIKEKYGITVEHLYCNHFNSLRKEKITYEDCFYKKYVSGKNAGKIMGFPITKGNWCKRLKTSVAKDNIRKFDIQYLGIAADEPARFNDLNENVVSPLVMAGWTEKMCYEWCKKNNLLSPIYNSTTRSGCWFCHNQTVTQLRRLRKEFPEYWAKLLQWDADSPTSFKANNITVYDFDKRFEMEDRNLLNPTGKNFKWEKVKEYERKK